MMKWHKLALGFLVGLTLVLSGCGGENASVPVATTPAASPQELAFNPLPVVSEFSGVVVTPPAPVVPITPATELGKLSVSLKTNSQYPLSKDRLTTFNKIFLKIDSVKVRSSTKENSTLESDWESLQVPDSIRGKPTDLAFFSKNSLALANGFIRSGKYTKLKIVFKPNVAGDNNRNYLNYQKQDIQTGLITSGEATLDFYSDAEKSLELPIDMTVGAGFPAAVGVTLDMRSIFEKVAGQFVFKPVATAFDEKNAGSINLILGPTDGSLIITAQRNGKIVRRVAVAASTANTEITIDQLPKTPEEGQSKEFYANPANSYQVLLFSPSYLSKIIKNIPVKANEVTYPSSFPIVSVSPTISPTLGIRWEPKLAGQSPYFNSTAGTYTAEIIENFGGIEFNMSLLMEFTPIIRYKTVDIAGGFLYRSFLQMPGNPQILDYSDPRGFVPIDMSQSQISIKTNSDLGNVTILDFPLFIGFTQRENFELSGQ